MEPGRHEREDSTLLEPAQVSPSKPEISEAQYLDEIFDSFEDSISVHEASVLKTNAKDARGKVVPPRLLQTDPTIGLSDQEVKDRRHKYGFNEVKPKRRNFIQKLTINLRGPIPWAILITIVVCLATADYWTGVVMLSFLLMNMATSWLHERRRGKVGVALQETLTPTCVAIRSSEQEIEVRDLVPGDIVKLETGFKVPADGRIVSPETLIRVDQCELTGESSALPKVAGDTVLQSSTVRQGTCLMMVTATNGQTYLGRSASLHKAAAGETSHWMQMVNFIAYGLLFQVVISMFMVWCVSTLRSKGISNIMGYIASIGANGAPMTLVLVTNFIMTIGARQMLRKNAIMKRLSSIESLAGVEFLCCDKTGTLTENNLSIGDLYNTNENASSDLLLTACLATPRRRSNLASIDNVCFKALKHLASAREAIYTYKVLDFTPFEPVTKTVTSVVQSPDGERITCVKGSPSVIAQTLVADSLENQSMLAEYHRQVETFATRGLRSVGVSRQRGADPWQLMGIISCLDPLREGVAKAIRNATVLGLKIKILTGDEVGVTKEVSRQLGLGDKVYHKDELQHLSTEISLQSNLSDLVHDADGFAGLLPQDKHDVVGILQDRGYLVAMTGDGDGDAPALTKANMGIAVASASITAKKAAHMILLKPGLSAIVDAIKLSRHILERLQCYVAYRIIISIHMIWLHKLWICVWDETLTGPGVTIISALTDVFVIPISYDRMPPTAQPLRWSLLRLYVHGFILGLILATASFLCLMTMRSFSDAASFPLAHGSGQSLKTMITGCGPSQALPNEVLTGFRSLTRTHNNCGIIQRHGDIQAVMLLQIFTSQTCTIFVTRARRGIWSWPSWWLIGSVATGNVLTALYCHFAWLQPKPGVDFRTIVCVWIYCFITLLIVAGVHTLLERDMPHERTGGNKGRKRGRTVQHPLHGSVRHQRSISLVRRARAEEVFNG